MEEAIIDVTEILDRQSLTSPFNVRLLLLGFFVTTAFGLECGASILFGPDLTRSDYQTATEYGVTLAESLTVVVFAPLILGYLADRFGRRPVFVGCAFAFGLLAPAVTAVMFLLPQSRDQLAALVKLSAIAYAGSLPILVALVCEFAPRRVRAVMTTLVFSGAIVGLGARVVLFVVSGVQVSSFLLWYGVSAPLAIAILLWFALPESPKYLALHPARRSELVALLHRVDDALQIGPAMQFVVSGEDDKPRSTFSALFAGSLAALTPLYWIANFTALLVAASIDEWSGRALLAYGLPIEQAAIAALLLKFGGVLAGLLIMRPLDTSGYWPVPILFACAIPIVFSLNDEGVATTTLLAGAWFCLLGVQFGNIGTAAGIYPSSVRALGLSLIFAAGRLGSGLWFPLSDPELQFYLHVWRPFALAALPLAAGLIAATLIVPRYRALLRDR